MPTQSRCCFQNIKWRVPEFFAKPTFDSGMWRVILNKRRQQGADVAGPLRGQERFRDESLAKNSEANTADCPRETNWPEQAHDLESSAWPEGENEVDKFVEWSPSCSFSEARVTYREDPQLFLPRHPLHSPFPAKNVALEIECDLGQTENGNSKQAIEVTASVLLIIHYKGFLLNKIHSTQTNSCEQQPFESKSTSHIRGCFLA